MRSCYKYSTENRKVSHYNYQKVKKRSKPNDDVLWKRINRDSQKAIIKGCNYHGPKAILSNYHTTHQCDWKQSCVPLHLQTSRPRSILEIYNLSVWKPHSLIRSLLLFLSNVHSCLHLQTQSLVSELWPRTSSSVDPI